MTRRLQIGITFIIIQMSFGYLIYPDLIYELTNTAHWELVMSHGIVQLFLIWVYIKGLSYYPQNDIVDIFLKIGRWAAFLFFIPFVINLIVLVAFNTRLHAEVIISIFLPRTPYWSIMILLFFISVYTATKGIGTILRCSVFICFIVIPLVIFNFFSSLVNFDLHNVTQAWDLPIQSWIDIKFFYLLGLSPFLFLGFMTSETILSFRQLFLTWICVILFILSVVYIPVFIFGQETVVRLTNPFVEAMDSVDISWFSFNRQAVFFGVSLVGLVIFANAVILWMIGHVAQKMFKCRKAKTSHWIISIAVLSFILALVVPSKTLNEKYFLWSIGAQAFFMVMTPFIIFIYGFVSERSVLEYEK
ncbi:GerAB/ArcD/ProY family transporter [Fictibacillus sp. NPDC058756]|uniref:GerAB/ArcD/ProY family transporter n=1 Tax=Fictibacillus sp. NPDC058756 TaxID=3346625 RepID=UPI0036C02E56